MADEWQKKPTVKGLTRHLREHGISLKKTEHNEFRVNHHKGKEETAYYTDDINDAGMTGLRMAKDRLNMETERGDHKPSVGGYSDHKHGGES